MKKLQQATNISVQYMLGTLAASMLVTRVDEVACWQHGCQTSTHTESRIGSKMDWSWDQLLLLNECHP